MHMAAIVSSQDCKCTWSVPFGTGPKMIISFLSYCPNVTSLVSQRKSLLAKEKQQRNYPDSQKPSCCGTSSHCKIIHHALS